MASIGFGARVHPSSVYREGITKIEPVDFQYAQELGYAIKLLAITERRPQGIEARVHPCMVALNHPLAQVDWVNNAVFIHGDLVGEVLLQGPGAGARPTASAVIGDLIDLARSIQRGARAYAHFVFHDVPVLPMDGFSTQAYFRCLVEDRPGVLAQIAAVFGEEQVSISRVIQKEIASSNGAAELVVTTHPAPDSALQRTRSRVGRLETVRAVSAVIRVF
jgi:homoserine dehydrogenase